MKDRKAPQVRGQEEVASLRARVAELEQEQVQRSRAEEALRESEQRSRTLFENAPVGIYRTTPSGRIVDANPALVRMLGYSSFEELAQRDVEEEGFEPGYSRGEFRERLEREGEVVGQEVFWKKRDGSSVLVRENARVIRGPDGEVLYYDGTVEDITEYKRAEQSLQESREMLQLVLDNIPQRIFWKDGDSVYRGCNRNFADDAGVEAPKDIDGKTDYDLPWKKEEADFYRQCDRRVMDTDTPEYNIIEPALRADGTQAWLGTNKVPLHDAEGNVAGILGTYEDITERRRAEEALHQYKHIVSSVTDMVALVDQRYVYLAANATYLQAFAKTPEKVIGRTVAEVCGQEFFSTVIKPRAERCLVGEDIRFQTWFEFPVAGRKYMDVAYSPYVGPDMEIQGLVATARDITESKRAEEALRQSEALRRTVINATKEAMISINQEGLITLFNPAAEEMFGRKKKEMIGQPLDCLMPEEYRARHREYVASYFAKGTPDRAIGRMLELPGLRSDGTEFPMEISLAAGRYGDKRFVIAVARDISERRRAEEALRESEARYRAVFEQAGDTIVLCDPETAAMVEFNDRAHENLGYTREEFQGLSLSDIDAVESAQDVAEHLRRLREGEVGSFETKQRTKGGELRNVLVTARVVSAGPRELVVGVWRDITERKLGEKKLRESREMLQLVLDNIPQRIFWKDREGVYLGGNRNFARDAGMEKQEDLLGKTDYDLPWKKEEADFYRECDRRVMDTDTAEYHIIEPELRADGTQAWVDTNKIPLHDAEGNVVGILGTYEDITEKLQVAEQLRQAQKMEAIGRLTSGIAHDFNNLLTIIMGNASFLLGKVGKESDLYQSLSDMEKASERASSLIKQLLAFSRKSVLQIQPTDLQRCVDDTVALLRRSIEPSIQIRVRSHPALWITRADRDQMNQVIMNLCVNARDAMPSGGKLTIETKNTVIDEAYCRANSQAKPGEYVELAITDTGTGMDKETLARIFEPFFTTKRPGVGTGLGLAMVYGIVSQHGGWITPQSRRKRGTKFRVFLPRTEAAEKEEAEQVQAELPGGSETILLVDDEQLVLEVGQRILTGLGYQTVSAADGEEAVRTLEDYKREIDLVVLDITLPRMDGYEVLSAMRRIHPEVKVILCSGNISADTAPGADERAAGLPMLYKPVSAAALARRVREVLDQ